MERCELDAVAVDLADVEVFSDFLDVGGRDVVCCAPDFGGGDVVLFFWLASHEGDDI